MLVHKHHTGKKESIVWRGRKIFCSREASFRIGPRPRRTAAPARVGWASFTSLLCCRGGRTQHGPSGVVSERRGGRSFAWRLQVLMRSATRGAANCWPRRWWSIDDRNRRNSINSYRPPMRTMLAARKIRRLITNLRMRQAALCTLALPTVWDAAV